jgi:hypothetical protein
MDYTIIKEKLNKYYIEIAPNSAIVLKEECYKALDEWYDNGDALSSYELKAMQYRCIADKITPVIFEDVPFYFETGALHPYSDGCYDRGSSDHGVFIHANGWAVQKRWHLYNDKTDGLLSLLEQNENDLLYIACGPFSDFEHFRVPHKKIFKMGLKGVYEEAIESLAKCET